jgi:Ca2+/Na+ antiporter
MLRKLLVFTFIVIIIGYWVDVFFPNGNSSAVLSEIVAAVFVVFVVSFVIFSRRYTQKMVDQLILFREENDSDSAKKLINVHQRKLISNPAKYENQIQKVFDGSIFEFCLRNQFDFSYNKDSTAYTPNKYFSSLFCVYEAISLIVGGTIYSPDDPVKFEAFLAKTTNAYYLKIHQSVVALKRGDYEGSIRAAEKLAEYKSDFHNFFSNFVLYKNFQAQENEKWKFYLERIKSSNYYKFVKKQNWQLLDKHYQFERGLIDE